MAQLTSDKYKPPMLVLEYFEKVPGLGVPSVQSTRELSNITKIITDSLSNNETIAKYTEETQKINLPKAADIGASPSAGKYGLNQIQNSGQKFSKVKSITSSDVNQSGTPFDNSSTESGLSKLDIQTARNLYSQGRIQRVDEGVWVRLSTPTGTLSYPTPHILLANVPSATEYVYPAAAPGSTTPGDTSVNYSTNKKGRYKKQFGGDDTFRVLMLEDDARNITPSGDGRIWVVIRYYKGWNSTIDEDTITLGLPIQTDNSADTIFTKTVSLILNKKQRDALLNLSKNADAAKRLLDQNLYVIDFQAISTHSDNFGFGIERFDFSGDSRKTVQQTRGKYTTFDIAEDNFFVDTWAKAPESITLSGVIELPYGYESNVTTLNGSTIAGKDGSFLNMIEKFFLWNNNPNRVNRGDYMMLRDLYRKQNYKVTFKSRRYSQSVERQSLVPFEFNFIVLDTISGDY